MSVKWDSHGMWTWRNHNYIIRYDTDKVDWNEILKLRFHLETLIFTTSIYKTNDIFEIMQQPLLM
jgi:hypothetical protein